MKTNIQKAIRYLEDLDYLSAESYIRSELAKGKDSSAAHAGLAICYANQNKISEAKVEAQKVVDTTQDLFLLYIALGKIAENEGNPLESERYYQEAVEIGKEHAYPWFVLGTFLLKNNKYKESIANLSRAKQIDADLWAPRANLAISYLRTENYKLSFREAVSVIVKKPNFRVFHVAIVSFFSAYPIIMWVLYGLSLMFFIQNPFSVWSLALVSFIGTVLFIINYLRTNSKLYVVFAILLPLVALAFYFIYIK